MSLALKQSTLCMAVSQRHLRLCSQGSSPDSAQYSLDALIGTLVTAQDILSERVVDALTELTTLIFTRHLDDPSATHLVALILQ